MATPQSIVDESAEATFNTLVLAGRGMRNDEVITMDGDLAPREYADEHATIEPGRYAADLVIETKCPDEGMRLLVSTGGPKVYLQHILDFDEWYVVAIDDSAQCIIEITPDTDEDHADAQRALDHLKSYYAGDITYVAG